MKKFKKIAISLVALILIAGGYYISVYKSFAYRSYNETIGNGVTIISVLVLLGTWLNTNYNENSKRVKYVYVPLAAAIVFLIIIVIDVKKQSHLEEELNKYGIITVGKVVGFEEESHRHSTTHYATLQYEFENKQLIQRIRSNDDVFVLNQNLNIKISKRDPEMFEVIKPKK